MRRRRISISTRLSFLFILLVIGLPVASNNLVGIQISRLMRQQLEINQRNSLNQIRINVENFMNVLVTTTVLFYADETLFSLLETDTADSFKRINTMRRLMERVSSIATLPMTSATSGFYSVDTTLFVDDSFPMARHLPSSALRDSYDDGGICRKDGILQEAWYAEVMRRRGLYTFRLPEDPDHLYIATRIDNSSGSFTSKYSLGILAVRIEVSRMKQYFDLGRPTANTGILLVNQDNMPIYENTAQPREVMQQAAVLAGEYATIRSFRTVHIGGSPYLIAIDAISTGWRLVTVTPESDITTGTHIIWRTILLTTLITIALGSLLIFILSQRITKPIRHLTRIVSDIRAPEQFDAVVMPNPSSDEISLLYEKFNALFSRVHQLMADVYEGGKREKSLELKALQSQINPHFIYNTLDSINWLALSSQQPVIARMVTSLAGILRYSIRNPGEPATLGEELAHVRNYVDIQTLCYSLDVSIETALSEATLLLRMPRILIQPLVENAITHGLQGSGRIGVIRISGEESGSFMLQHVEDNGTGCDTELLNRYMAGQVEHLGASDGIGIKNVHERLQLLHGPQSGLIFSTGEDGGTRATLRIPLDAPPPEQVRKIADMNDKSSH